MFYQLTDMHYFNKKNLGSICIGWIHLMMAYEVKTCSEYILLMIPVFYYIE
jgi:hypothetical protein